MIISTLKLFPSPQRRRQMLEILHSVQGRTQACSGCAACGVYTEETPEQAILIVERWESKIALEEHIRSDPYRRILAAIELSSRQPEVCFDHITATEGMEFIEGLRDEKKEIALPATSASAK